MSVAIQVKKAAETLRDSVNNLRFSERAAYVYNPLDYAWEMHAAYVDKFARATCDVIFLGMNPGPFGMAQTGIPFGEVKAVRDWMKLDAPISSSIKTHPSRPILGLQCKRSEVSGKRLWGLFQSRYGSADVFFKKHYVLNYCPLLFLEEGGRNLTPDKLPSADLKQLYHYCDEHIRDVVTAMQPTYLVGVGQFAEKRLSMVFGDTVTIARVLHPSPASPAANRGWAAQAANELEATGVSTNS